MNRMKYQYTPVSSIKIEGISNVYLSWVQYNNCSFYRNIPYYIFVYTKYYLNT